MTEFLRTVRHPSHRDEFVSAPAYIRQLRSGLVEVGFARTRVNSRKLVIHEEVLTLIWPTAGAVEDAEKAFYIAIQAEQRLRHGSLR